MHLDAEDIKLSDSTVIHLLFSFWHDLVVKYLLYISPEKTL